MKTKFKRYTAMLLTMVMLLSLLSGIGMSYAGTISVKIIGENEVLVDETLSLSDIVDYTTDSEDTNTGLNALDAVISVTEHNSSGDYDITYNALYSSYYLNKVAGVTPHDSDYWGTLVVDEMGNVNGNALSTHALASGDTYIIYYDQYTGRAANYGYQSYAQFTDETLSGTTGNLVDVKVETTVNDNNYNLVKVGLEDATLYATGGDYTIPTAVGKTNTSGEASVVFNKAGTYVLTLSSDYTFTKCTVTITGSSANAEDINVKIIGKDGILVQDTIKPEAITDYTTHETDTSTALNALDAVLSVEQGHTYGVNNTTGSSFSISYTTGSGYYISKVATVTPENPDYWGTVAIDEFGNLDGNALSSHVATSGDTYIVYYDAYTGRAENYGYQSYAWFTEQSVSGTTMLPFKVNVKTVAYDAQFNLVEKDLSGAIVYATGGDYQVPTPVGTTNASGEAYITLSSIGTYTLTLSSDYTYAQCYVSMSENSETLYDTTITLSDGAVSTDNATLVIKDAENNIYTPTKINASNYIYKLSLGTYTYSLSKAGYETVTGSFTVENSATFDIDLQAAAQFAVTIKLGDATHETLTVSTSDGTAQTADTVSDGIYTFELSNGSYSLCVSRSGYHSVFDDFTVAGSDLEITKEALSDMGATEAEWPSFRGFANNMAVTSDATAQGAWQVKEAWTTSLGDLGSYGTLSTSNTILYDDYLYVATEHGLSKLERQTGRLITTTPLSETTSYVLQAAYGDGKIFVTHGKGLDAFDALTMERVWSAEISSYGNYMATTPLCYDPLKKIIYVGDYGDSNHTLGTYGGYSAIDASSGKSEWILYGDESDARYWAGAVIVDDYVIFGSNSGIVTSVNRNTTDINSYGSLTDTAGTLEVEGKINSTISYDGVSIYFTTHSGYLYKVALDSSDGTMTEVASRQFSTGSSSTPVVKDGVIYVGANDGIYVLNADDLSQVAHFETAQSVQSSALVTSEAPGVTYAYFTVNSARGEVRVVKKEGEAITEETLFVPSHQQYNTGSLISDDNGTIYYTNDSGYISALENTLASSENLAKVSFVITPDSVLNSSTYKTVYPKVALKDSTGDLVDTEAGNTYYLGTGNYTYSVALEGYETKNGQFTLTEENLSATHTITAVLEKLTSGDTPKEMSVTVSVKGYNNSSIVGSTKVKAEKGATAWTVIKKVLDDKNISYKSDNSSMGIYISSVNGLAEFDKGANSGWQYTINGTQPSVSMNYSTVSDGDKVVLYYTSDYVKERESSSSAPTPSSKVEVKATVDNTGIASVKLGGASLTAFNKAVEALEDKVGEKATISVDTSDNTSGAKVTLPNDVISMLKKKEHTSLNIETNMSTLTFDATSLDKIGDLMENEDVTFSVSKVDVTTLSPQNQALVGDHLVFDFSLLIGDKKMTDFGEGAVSISIPYTPSEDEEPSNIKILYIDDKNVATEVEGAYYDETTGAVVFKTTHFSVYAIVNGLPEVFKDVHKDAWYYTAVNYVSQHNLMNGTGDMMFEPNGNMTRAMFVTILYNLEGRPETLGKNTFTDVPSGEWYTAPITWAKESGIVAGYGDGTFGCMDNVTQEQIAVMLKNYAAFKAFEDLDMNVTDKATVFNSSDWATVAVSWAYENKIISNSGENKFVPRDDASRAQGAAMLMNFCENCME